MHALLSYDQAPPLSAPLRFFLSAPVFGILAALLMLWLGPEIFASRWTPGALALTHLMTVGFMLQAMIGALVQILPVVAGANMAQPRLLISAVHLGLCVGTLALVTAFLTFSPLAFALAALFLGLAVGSFIALAAYALWQSPAQSPTIQGLKFALIGLLVTLTLGVLLSLALSAGLQFSLLRMANTHLGWGFAAWSAIMLAAVSYLVVPMFQLTPAYPKFLTEYFSITLFSAVLLWSLADLADLPELLAGLGIAIVLLVIVFAVSTLRLQARSRRAKLDVTQRYWWCAMWSTVAACVLWLAARGVPVITAWQGWPLLFAVLLIFGGFVSVIVGMLYKIVPFLIWLDLQARGQGQVLAPNMKKILAESALRQQIKVHFLAFILLVLSVFQSAWFIYPAALALLAANVLLLKNLLSALSVHRQQCRRISALLSPA